MKKANIYQVRKYKGEYWLAEMLKHKVPDMKIDTYKTYYNSYYFSDCEKARAFLEELTKKERGN